MQKLENKSVMFFAIETGDLELVKLLAEKNLYDGKKLESEQWKQRSESPVAPGWVKVTIRCLDNGTYKPSDYAARLDLKEIQQYLESKDL